MRDDKHENDRGETGRNSNPEYEVGYRRPPKQFQFKKGQSGNPAGAPKRKALTLGAAVAQAFEQTVSVRINGKELNVSGVAALYIGDIHDAFAGNLTALRNILKLAKKSHRFADPKNMRGVVVLPEDPESEQAQIRREYFEAKAAGEDPFAKYGLDGTHGVGGVNEQGD